jgi:hypothetical protein
VAGRDLVPGGADDGVAVAFQLALAVKVVGAGEHLIVELHAVGLEEHAVVRPAEVGEVAQAALVDLGMGRPACSRTASTMSSYSLRVGAAVARIARSCLAPRCLLVTSSAGFTARWFRASLTALRVPSKGSIEERS